MEGVQEMEKKLLSADTSSWCSWAQAALDGATARLKQGGVQAEVLPTILKMLASMVCGQEAAHLRRLLWWADHEGSDVILRDGCLLQGSAQIVPYTGLPLLPHFRESSGGCDCIQGTFLIPQPQPCLSPYLLHLRYFFVLRRVPSDHFQLATQRRRLAARWPWTIWVT